MAYKFHLDKMLCPVAPSKLELKIKNQNKTMVLISGEEINILKQAGLTDISFDLLLPNVQYPFAVYEDGFKTADYFLSKLEQLKVDKKPFQFYVERTLPNGKILFPNNMRVSLEDYTIKEDAKQGFDVVVTVKLKQYKDYGTKLVKVITNNTATVETKRETSNSPEPTKSTTYTVKSGDTLWAIAKAFYGDGSKYPAIYEANKDIIANPSLIYAGQVLTIPGATQAGTLVEKSKVNKPITTSGSAVQNNQTHRVIINFTGIKLFYGKVRVSYTFNGKSRSAEYSNSAGFIADKGTLAKIIPVPLTDKATFTFKFDKNVKWTNITAISTPGGKKNPSEVGKQAKIDADSNVTITWLGR